MAQFFWIIGSTILISAISLVGIFFLYLNAKHLEKYLLALVALASGALLGGAFLHLLPGAVEKLEGEKVFEWTLVSLLVFFLIEKIFQWRHCHKDHCEIHSFGYMSLFGDSIHNFIDGLVIAAAFIESTSLGLVVSLGVILHEIPQEIGDFSTLLLAGFSNRKALLMNFIIALMAVCGGIVGFFLASYSSNFINILIPFAAGGFIYIAASDLIPEIRKETNIKRSIKTLLFFLLGMILIYLMKFLE
jgi:zinc and cadmium transporter